MDQSVYKKFAEMEEKMWWFMARKNIIEEIIKPISMELGRPRILDFGAGLGIISEMMNKYGEVTAVDKSTEVNKYNKFPITLVDNLDNFSDKSFGIVTAFDVLEHCQDDVAIIKDFCRIVHQGAYVFVTIPAFQSLWSQHDVFSHHFRRYSKKELVNKFVQAGFSIEKISYFNFFLFPLFIINILFNRFVNLFFTKKKDTLELPNTIVNSLLFRIFNLEKNWLKKFSFPWGSSMILVAKKQ